MREGPGKNAVKQKALRVLKQKKQYEQQVGRQTCIRMQFYGIHEQMTRKYKELGFW